MKVGDTIEIRDGSGSLCIDRSTSPMKCDHIDGNSLRGIKWVVKAIGGPYPRESHMWESDYKMPPNDMMVVDPNNAERILFTSQRYCAVIESTPYVVTIPAGVKQFTVRVE